MRVSVRSPSIMERVRLTNRQVAAEIHGDGTVHGCIRALDHPAVFMGGGWEDGEGRGGGQREGC